ncbi:MAG: thermonuclease family protein [bacterium]
MKSALSACLFVAILLVPVLGRPTCGVGEWRKVSEVFDGDTLRLKGGEKVRLIGIDAPELHESDKLERDARRSHRDRKTIQKMGRQSYEVFKKLVGKGPVRLELDETTRDKYGRTLAYVYACLPQKQFESIVLGGPPAKSKSPLREYQLNREMIRYGWAEAFRSFSYREKPEFFRLESEAREANRGLWEE